MSGFFGNIVNQAMNALGAEAQQKLGGSFSELLQGQGLQALRQQAENAGLADKVRSWIGNGENLPISAAEIRNLLTDQQLEAFVSRTGIPASVILPALAEFLPTAVDQHTTSNPA
ncbi:hypothetical protein AA101099_2071 [Neoasaia chiangmaiensis NBRC 101099]|uniref:Uncharacterized protein n=1 Tax=Neoasaia chiangmaiensis TaxID=320497 RepID=A0A1U9KSZ7_9PROT|nr:YidB family protein [Neoasaia chiangmaiensis]AQS88933.1 hypothetical protein A0U93_14545 [Neoasaia chiangmaiensis]GBR40350.1 hypothetical protein AA101099_2071 [Neoasaia chiangmaiensis NBRC 101099]GEN13942.1 hypothetical protein NCH01_03730 [Neoasaia chiangmaiensis]